MLKGYFHVIWGVRIGVSTHVFTTFNIIDRWKICIYPFVVIYFITFHEYYFVNIFHRNYIGKILVDIKRKT